MFDQDHGLIQPFTAKDNQYLIANLHQNNSNDVFMFPFQSQSHLRRKRTQKAWPDCVHFILLHRGKTMRVCRSILDRWKYSHSQPIHCDPGHQI